MPSALHEGLIELFRERPALAAELLQDVFRVELPEYTDIEVRDSNLSQLLPTEFRADLVLLMRNREPVYAAVVEVQLSRSDDKLYAWPAYAANVRSKYRCHCSVLVVAPDPEVAAWANQPIEIDVANYYQVCVLGRSAIPLVAEPKGYSAELSVLSALTHHAEDGGINAVFSAAVLSLGLDDARAKLYLDLIQSQLGPAMQRELWAMLENGNYTYQSEFARKYYAQGREEGRAEGWQEGKQEGREEGRAEGRQEGKQEGREEGRVQGRAQEAAQAVLAILEARELVVSNDLRDRILGTTDLETLHKWRRVAIAAKSAEELFR